jgi:hypothetical protein
MKIKKVFEVTMKDGSREYIFAYSRGQARRHAGQKFYSRKPVTVTELEIT